MLINENRLSLADAKARKYLEEQMDNYFFGGGADEAAGYVPPQTITCRKSCMPREVDTEPVERR